jgi:hypothetical protein
MLYAGNCFHYLVEKCCGVDEIMLHLSGWAVVALSWLSLSKLFVKSLPFVRGDKVENVL